MGKLQQAIELVSNPVTLRWENYLVVVVLGLFVCGFFKKKKKKKAIVIIIRGNSLIVNSPWVRGALAVSPTC